MKILILDIETTGFNQYVDAIVEVGMALVDTNTSKIERIYDKVVKDDRFDEKKHKDAWIFENSTLKVEDVLNAPSLNSLKGEIQSLLDEYPLTAFNMKFDTKFMDAVGFKFKPTKCLMEASKPFNKNFDRRGRQKTPSVEEIYAQFYPNETYIEEHRGCDDAYHEGKILLKLVEFKKEGKTRI